MFSRSRLAGLAVGLAVILLPALLILGQPKGGWIARWGAAPTPTASAPGERSTDRDESRQPPQVGAGETVRGSAVSTEHSNPAATAASSSGAGLQFSALELLNRAQLPAGHPERRLLEVYAHVEQGQWTQALQRSRALVSDFPNFQLAQLVHGDLLRLRYEPSAAVDAPGAGPTAQSQMAALRAESRMRLEALHHRPDARSVPRQLLSLTAQNQHVIAIDASRGRLYWFEQQPGHPQGSLKLLADYFISVGKSGIRKQLEGDGRTPVGVYFVTSVRDRKSLPDFYGAGALPINYPNAFDVHRGRTGSGIWLHGTPPNQFVRAPLASDGCVVLSNPDMQRLLDEVAPRNTPVIIAEKLDWVDPSSLDAERTGFTQLLQRWQTDRSRLTAAELNQAYQARPIGFQKVKATDPDWTVSTEVSLGLTNLGLFVTQDPEPGMVATFDETVDGRATGVVRRQYWVNQDNQWRLLQDTVIAGTPAPGLRRKPPRAVVAESAPEATPPGRTAPDEPNPPVKSGRQAQGSSEPSVQKAVDAWAQAWRQKNMGAYLRAYDASFDPPGGQTRKAWEKDRADRILGKSSISLTLRQVNIRTEGDRATVTFVQHYKADRLEVTGRKTLKLVRRGNDWRITHESVG